MICPKCTTKNENIANYCSHCKFPLKETDISTIEMFSELNLTPISLIKFESRKGRKIMTVLWLSLLLFSIVNYLDWSSFLYRYKALTGILDEYFWISVIAVPGIIAFICLLYAFVKMCNCLKIRYGADYVETRECCENFRRIIKKKKFGLCNLSKRKIVVKAKYDYIELFDKDHFLLKQKEKKGLYSIPFKRVILKPRCDFVEKFQNSRTKVYKEGIYYYIDIKGNILK